MAQAGRPDSTILAFPRKLKRPVRNPRLTNEEFRESGAHLLNEELYEGPYLTVDRLILYALVMALPPEIAVKIAATTSFWAEEKRFDADYRQAADVASATMERRVQKASRDLSRYAKHGAS